MAWVCEAAHNTMIEMRARKQTPDGPCFCGFDLDSVKGSRSSEAKEIAGVTESLPF